MLRPLVLAPLAILLPLGPGRPALAQEDLPEETVRREVNLATVRLTAEKLEPVIDIASFKGRYQHETESFRRLLPLAPTIRRCVDAQRAAGGEFHTRLDFSLEPSGRILAFTVASSRYPQLQGCLAPHALALRFPPFKGSPRQLFQVLVASPGATLGGPGRHLSKALPVYPIETPDERKTYAMAVGWVFSPWSMAISRCGELVDQTLGFGYRFSLTIDIAKTGRPLRLEAEARGKVASKALDLFLRCSTPFVKALDVPPHKGDLFAYRMGTTTAGWGIR